MGESIRTVARLRPGFSPTLAAVALLVVSGRGGAQVRGSPVLPAEPAAAVRVASLMRPVAVHADEVIPATAHVPAPVGPVPGLPEPEPVPPACPDPFRFPTRNGGAVAGLPALLLWEPPLAGKHEPRFQILPTTLSNGFTQQTLDTTIGGTAGLLRVEPSARPTAFQLDVFALVNTRFSQHDFLVGSDYRFGFPVTFARGEWHGKVGYEHTSTHLGDETIARTGRAPFDFIKDELVVAAGRWLWDRRVRLYGEAAWAFSQYVPGDPSPFRFDLGFEWVRRRATGCWGQPFAAGNLEFNGSVGYEPNLTLQAGWRWHDPTRRFGQARVFAEYYTGYSPYGQFFQDRESWFGIGVAFDY